MPDSSLRIGVIHARRSSGIDAPENGATTTLEVDQVSATEALSVIDVIAEAFVDDPTWSWAVPDPTARSQCRRWPGRHGHVAKEPINSHIAGCHMEIPYVQAPLDDDIRPCAGDNGLDLCLLGLGDSNLSKVC
jgi:hypothetical protein